MAEKQPAADPEQVLRQTLAMIAPGTVLRDGLERIVLGRTGGLILLGHDKLVDQLTGGGFTLDVELTATRLRELATLNFDRLGLLPMEPQQFGDATQVSMPPPPVAEDLFINNPQDVMGMLDISTITPADPEGEAVP